MLRGQFINFKPKQSKKMQNIPANLSIAAEDKTIPQPSAEFGKKVRRVTWALIAFIVVYIVFTFAGLIIALGMVGLGALLLANIQVILIMILGIGLILSGLMLIYFLISSIFIKAPVRADRYEITETEQPELFDFIRQLTIESGAPFPKHIYLTPEVNASVFFDSSFWSMLFPVRKNLTIGIALVNCLNQSEFKAIMAHEFGHFSQRSMRFGSYVYNFNKVIHNTLYANKNYDLILKAWARWHLILRLMAMLNIKIIKIIQDTLRKMYIYINKAYLELSREMEFHADAIAAYYGGANNMTTALRRIDAGDECYNTVLNVLNQKLHDGYYSDNIYFLHLYILRHFAKENQLLTDQNGIPMIKKGIAVLKNSRVDLKNPWSSHPSMAQREAKLNKINVILEPVEKPASLLFKNIVKIQEQLTGQMYQNVNADYMKLKVMNADMFIKDFEEEFESNSYNTDYKGFYNSRLLTEFDVNDAVALAQIKPITTFEHLFTEENCNLPKAIIGMQHDIATLTNISEGSTDIINFDFEGTSYSKDSADDINKIINTQIEAAREKIASLDKDIFIYFYQLAERKGLEQQILDKYHQIFNYQQLAQADYDNYNNLMKELSPIYTKMQPGEIYETLDLVYKREKTVKRRISEVMADPLLTPYITDTKKQPIDTYLSKNWVYYAEPVYDNNAIGVLNSAINAYVSIISERNFQHKKKLFDFQLSLIDT